MRDVNRSSRLIRVLEGSQILVDVRNVILKYNILKSVKAVNKENLFSKVG